MTSIRFIIAHPVHGLARFIQRLFIFLCRRLFSERHVAVGSYDRGGVRSCASVRKLFLAREGPQGAQHRAKTRCSSATSTSTRFIHPCIQILLIYLAGLQAEPLKGFKAMPVMINACCAQDEDCGEDIGITFLNEITADRCLRVVGGLKVRYPSRISRTSSSAASVRRTDYVLELCRLEYPLLADRDAPVILKTESTSISRQG